MDLSTFRTRVRRDLHDEDATNYRWTNDELDRHIDHAVREFSGYVPREMKATIATVSGSREVNISTLTDRVIVFAVEYKIGYFPPRYQRFSLYQDTLILIGDTVPDGGNCYVYYGKLHTLNGTPASSTIPSRHEDLLAQGAEGYALLSYAAYSVNRVLVGGRQEDRDFLTIGNARILEFKKQLKKLGYQGRVRIARLYPPWQEPESKSTDWGP